MDILMSRAKVADGDHSLFVLHMPVHARQEVAVSSRTQEQNIQQKQQLTQVKWVRERP